ncbi:porin PorA family protein [Nocardia sp. NBC_01377]|uniref:porin PorA family protein n=1 Tax=Nocardia sp. NBC_01377 TaxID=2903595 RepID=UPI003248AAF7
MKIRKSAAVLATVGVILLACDAIFYFGALPAFDKLPGNLDITMNYEGHASMLNSEALAAGDVAHAMLENLPITVQRRMYISSTTSDTAIYHEESTIAGLNGLTLKGTHVYAVDRHSLGRATAPSDATVEEHSGLTVAFPIDPPADDSLQLWDAYTQKPTPAKYLGSDTISGRDVKRYVMTTEGPLADPALLQSLPPVLPKAVVELMLPVLSVESRNALETSLPAAGDMLPITYRSSGKLTLGVDTQLGSPVDGAQQQTITAVAQVGDRAIDLLPMMVTDVKITEDSRNSAVDTVRSAGRKLTLVTIVAPLVLGFIGIVLVLGGLVINRRRK